MTIIAKLRHDHRGSGAVDSSAGYEILDFDTYVVETFNVSRDQLALLKKLFDSSFFEAERDRVQVRQDFPTLFKSFFMDQTDFNVSISPYINTAFLQQQLVDVDLVAEVGSCTPCECLILWIKNQDKGIVPWAYFDTEYYLQENTDVRDAEISPFLHFVLHGCHEGRYPSKYVEDLLATTLSTVHPINLHSLFASVPSVLQSSFLTQETISNFEQIFSREIYLKSQIASENISSDSAFAHALMYAVERGYRTTPFVNEKYYIELWDSRDGSAGIEHDGFDVVTRERYDRAIVVNPVLHWLIVGKNLGIIPCPVFNTDIYSSENRDLSTLGDIELFDHFCVFGAYEKNRPFSNYFNNRYYLAAKDLPKGRSPFIDYIANGQFEGIAPCSDMSHCNFDSEPLLQSSIVEEQAIILNRKIKKTQTGELAQIIERVRQLEPQIDRPYGRTLVRYAPVIHPEVPTLKVVSELEERYRTVSNDSLSDQVDTVVLIPHCRMAGSARIAGDFAKCMGEIHGAEKLLIISTDASHFERRDWFPEKAKFLDISDKVEELHSSKRVICLLDLLRTIQPNRVVNINSRLGWSLTDTYGRQLSSWFDIYAYLFCWDLDAKGNKGGYPIQWFLPSFNYLRHVFTDSQALKNELESRYSLSGIKASKITALHTPMDIRNITRVSKKFEPENGTRRKRCFWSGRFDRQKRFDLVVEIAKLQSDLDIYVWGKEVIEDFDMSELEMSDNIKLMGEYSKIDDIPISGFDFFLYTSQWDGIPTVLIEVAVRGIPVVASDVGGVSEVIDDNTGWLVKDPLNPNSYVDQIREMYASDEMTKRAHNLVERSSRIFCLERYKKDIVSSMELTDHE